MTRLRSHGPPLTQWLYCLVVLLRRKYSTNNMDQSKISTIADPNELSFHSFREFYWINWKAPRLFSLARALQSSRSDLKHQISCPRSDFLISSGADRVHSFGALVPVSEWEGEEGVGPLLSALSPVLQSYNCYRRELQSHNGSPGRAPWQCDNSVKSQQLNTAQLNWTYSGHYRAGLETWDMDQRDKHDGDIYIE